MKRFSVYYDVPGQDIPEDLLALLSGVAMGAGFNIDGVSSVSTAGGVGSPGESFKRLTLVFTDNFPDSLSSMMQACIWLGERITTAIVAHAMDQEEA